MPILYTVGHSNHSLEEFSHLLHAYEINTIVDIRAIPHSRFVPWSNKEQLKKSLSKEKINYVHMPKLGGRRKTSKNSINTGWRNPSFRGFADYMQTAEFFLALKDLNQLVKKNKYVAIMCAEAVPWRCHRSLIADAEIIRGVKVLDILSPTSLKEHKLTEFAKIDKSAKPYKIYYPEMI